VTLLAASRRSTLPDVGQVFNLRPIFNRPVEGLDSSPGRRIKNPPQIENLPHENFALLAGPEGGWTDRERAAYLEHGWTPVSLGPTILRTETAAIAGIAIIMSTASNNSGPPESRL
jgi:16S rRNA (uracil1498-N3)-methyltransferase